MTDHWLKIDAGSEYDSHWQRFFSIREEERVTDIAERLASQAELLDSAKLWRGKSDVKTAWIVLVLHIKVDKILRYVGVDSSGRRYIETSLAWTQYEGRTGDESDAVILERVDLVFRALVEKLAS